MERKVKMTTIKTNLYRYFKSVKKIEFSNEILSRYYLSLKTKPFVILTGISGTGKTKIAQIFADYMCQNEKTDEEKEKRIAFIPVRPDWMDNRGLLGYYNVLQGKYVKTKLLELLIDAGKKENKDHPYFVILDEMNLAKVEYYFSDFLSIMESRTENNSKGEAIILYDKEQIQDEIVPYEIHIPQNVYFTGTVNVDESTYMFSPKVLDRANVIEFNQVTLDENRQALGQQKDTDSEVIDINQETLDAESKKNDANKGNKFSLENKNVVDSLYSTNNIKLRFSELKNKDTGQDLEECSNEIVDLLMLLEKYNMHFGYRVADEMAHFILLASCEISEYNWKEALDIQILQKILPKWHGTRAKLEEPLEEVLKYCKGNKNNEVGSTIKYKFPRSVSKLEKMKDNLIKNGYASFIE